MAALVEVSTLSRVFSHKKNYSHCPPKKRPFKLFNEYLEDDKDKKICEASLPNEPENLSTKPQDLRVSPEKKIKHEPTHILPDSYESLKVERLTSVSEGSLSPPPLFHQEKDPEAEARYQYYQAEYQMALSSRIREPTLIQRDGQWSPTLEQRNHHIKCPQPTYPTVRYRERSPEPLNLRSPPSEMKSRLWNDPQYPPSSHLPFPSYGYPYANKQHSPLLNPAHLHSPSAVYPVSPPVWSNSDRRDHLSPYGPREAHSPSQYPTMIKREAHPVHHPDHITSSRVLPFYGLEGDVKLHSPDDGSVCDSAVSSHVSSSSSSSSGVSKKRKDAPRYQCDDCAKSYSTFSGLSKHQQFHCQTTNKKSFGCKYCEKVYVSLGALKMHIRTHTLPCKCNLCGKAFSRPWLLQGHIRTHTGEKPFTCQHCNRAFADRSNLRAHLQTHSDIKKYNCKTCAKTFSRMSLLIKHEEGGCPGSISPTSSISSSTSISSLSPTSSTSSIGSIPLSMMRSAPTHVIRPVPIIAS